MTELLTSVDAGIKVLWSIGVLVVVVWGFIWIRGLINKQRGDVVNEITYEGKNIALKVDSTPLADLVNESNKQHGTNSTGNDPEKK